MKAILITTGGEAQHIEVNNLEDLQKAVGGRIEILHFPRIDVLRRIETVAYINEEGKLMDLLPNMLATQLCTMFGVGLQTGDFICGDMVFVGLDHKTGATVSLPEKSDSVILNAVTHLKTCNGRPREGSHRRKK